MNASSILPIEFSASVASPATSGGAPRVTIVPANAASNPASTS